MKDVADRDTLSRLSLLWKALGDDGSSGGNANTLAALEQLLLLEPPQEAAAQRRAWIKAFVQSILDRYDDPIQTLQAVDALYFVWDILTT